MAIEFGPKDRYRTYGVPSLDLPFADRKSLVDRISGNNLITFTRSTTGTYVGADGLIKTAAVNEPRFDHDPLTGESLGLLVEEARDNNQSNSNTFSSWVDKVGVTLQENLYSDPFGTNTATRIIPTAVSTSHYIGRYQGYGPGGYAHSIFLKPAGYYKLVISVNGNTFTVDLSGDGSYTASSFPTIVYVTRLQKFSNGWFRIEFTWNNTGGGGGANTVQPRINILDNSGNSTFSGDGISGIDFFGYQQENAYFSTSYIPTSGSAVTRAADIASITGTNFSSWYNQSEGTLYSRSSAYSPALAGYLQGSASSDRILLLPDSNNRLRYQITVSGPTIVDSYTANNLAFANQTVRVAEAFKSGSYSLGCQGQIGPTSTVAVSPPIVSKLEIGRETAFNNYLNGTISRLTYYPTRLPDATLQGLTST